MKYVLAAECFRYKEPEYWQSVRQGVDPVLEVQDYPFGGGPYCLVTIPGLKREELEPLMIVEFDGTEGIRLDLWERQGVIIPLDEGMEYSMEPHVVTEYYSKADGQSFSQDMFYGARTVVRSRPAVMEVESRRRGRRGEFVIPEPEVEPVAEEPVEGGEE